MDTRIMSYELGYPESGTLTRHYMWVNNGLLLVLYSALKGFSQGTPVFRPPKKPTFSNSNWVLECTEISQRVVVNSLMLYNVWMLETTQRIIKLLGLLLPDLFQIDCKAGTTAERQKLLANISTIKLDFFRTNTTRKKNSSKIYN